MTIYLLESSVLSEEQLEAMAACLPAERLSRTLQIHNPSTRRESIAAGYLAFYGIAESGHHGLHLIEASSLMEKEAAVRSLASAVGWPIGERGKPFPDGVVLNDGRVFVNISHSDGLVAVAVAAVPVGIDIQREGTPSSDRLLRIASKLHPIERERLLGVSDEARPSAFFQLWACKESVMKLCGRGLSLPLSSFIIEQGGCCELDGRRIELFTKEVLNAVLAVAVWEGSTSLKEL
jgi:hypothetical protein